MQLNPLCVIKPSLTPLVRKQFESVVIPKGFSPMRKATALAICFSAVLLVTVTASSARADVICADDQIVKLNNFEGFVLNLPDQSRASSVPIFSEEFENNQGKHLGFSMASTRGNKFGLFKTPHPSSNRGGGSGSDTIPNPEPAAVLLMGTGLAAAGAYARRRFRKE